MPDLRVRWRPVAVTSVTDMEGAPGAGRIRMAQGMARERPFVEIARRTLSERTGEIRSKESKRPTLASAACRSMRPAVGWPPRPWRKRCPNRGGSVRGTGRESMLLLRARGRKRTETDAPRSLGRSNSRVRCAASRRTAPAGDGSNCGEPYHGVGRLSTTSDAAPRLMLRTRPAGQSCRFTAA